MLILTSFNFLLLIWCARRCLPGRGTSIEALPGPFDLIVGSDITYDADYFDVLLDSIDALCSSSDPETVCFSFSFF